jgi:RimJ/RimL family protein N-acetyltransferase
VVHGSVLLNLMANSDGSPPDVLEVGWHLHPDSWGHGYATEAAQGAVQYAFGRGEPEVHAVVYPRNVRSLAVCRRLGMTPLGPTDRWYGVPLEAFRLAAP